MSNKVKFGRKVNIRSRSSDRAIFWYAMAVAAAAHVLFFGLFNYRRPVRPGDDSGAAVTMLTLSDFPKSEREGFRWWLVYNDPRDPGYGNFREALVDKKLRDALPKDDRRKPTAAEIPVRPAAVGKFREVPGRKLPSPTLLPDPPYDESKPAVFAGAVTDGEGRSLPLGGVKLPPRTPRATGRTVLRVFRSGATPTLFLEHSCGDAKLDDFAIRELLFLTRGGTLPEFIYVDWPEADK